MADTGITCVTVACDQKEMNSSDVILGGFEEGKIMQVCDIILITDGKSENI